MPANDTSGVEQDPTVLLSVEDEMVAATRYEPTDFDNPLPAVLWYTPYHKDDETTFGRYDPLLEYVAAQGYEVIAADMVGTGASTGYRSEFFGPDVGREAAAVIEAIAARPWTTDCVGMLGKSFPGSICLAAAAEDPDPLDAIVPILTSHRRERLAFDQGGLPQLWLPMTMVALYTTAGVQPPSRRPTGWEESWRARLDHFEDAGPPFIRALAPDPDDPYWDDAIPVERIEVPTFAVGGYRDHFPSDTLAYFSSINAPKRLLMGPWRHINPYQGRETAVGLRRQVVDWFDRFLKDEPVEPFEPRIAFWTERDGGRQIEGGHWRGCRTWPDVNHRETYIHSFAATPSGLQRMAAFDSGAVERTYEVDHTVGLEAHDINVPFVDTNADDARSITFESAPFDHPIELTGTGAASVQVAADGQTLVCVRLVDLSPDGRARPMTRGTARVEETTDTISVNLAPLSHVLEAGHQLRVVISAADFPSHVPDGTAESLVLTSTPSAPTTVRIPGREHPPESFEDSVSMPQPDDTIPLAPPAIESTDVAWETTREHHHERATRRRHVATDFALPHVEKTYELDVEATVGSDDPGTLSARATIESVIEFADNPVTVATTVYKETGTATVETTVRFDGDTVYEQEWST